MKQVIYIFVFISFLTANVQAQFVAGIVASSVVNRTIVAPDVELKASFTNNAGEISWKAPGKLSVRRYELEKSNDGENFSYITSVAANSSSYSITDNNIFENNNYYRIKIVAADGNYMYSTTTSLDATTSAGAIKVMPTQINQKVFIWVPVNTTVNRASIADASGRTVISNASISNSSNLSAIETATLPAGLYHISIQTNKGETIRLKFNKQSI